MSRFQRPSRRNSRSVRRSQRRAQLRYEELESRRLMFASHVFAQFPGDISDSAPQQPVSFSLAPGDFSLSGSSTVLGFHVQPHRCTSLDPSAVQILDAAGQSVATRWNTNNVAGSSNSLVIANLSGGNYTVVVRADGGTRGGFMLNVFLAGDVLNGDHKVDMNDLTHARNLLGAKAGSANYKIEADANLDGIVSSFDYTQARDNLNDSTRIKPLAVTASVIPAPVVLPNGTLATNQSTISILGDTSSLVGVALETGTDSRFDEGLTTSDTAGAYSFSALPIQVGVNTLQVRAKDGFGQQAFASVGLLFDNVAPTIVVNQPIPSASSTNLSLSGAVSDDLSGVKGLRASIDGGAEFSVAFDAAGNFSFMTSFVLDGSADGPHTLRFIGTDYVGNTSAPSDWIWILDTVAPAIDFDLSPPDDSAPLGDHRTTFESVTLVGQTEPGVRVVLEQTGASTTADTNGRFQFDNVALALGVNLFSTRATDVAGNNSRFERVITRDSLNCTFDASLTGWTTFESGGTPTGHGTVIPQNCAAVISEGDSFVTGLKRSFVVPTTPSALQFTITDPAFDTTEADSIKDAFEIAIVDQQGRLLVHSYTSNREAAFNESEGLPPVDAPEVIVDGYTVTVDLSRIPSGSEAFAVIRLINNDADRATSVSVSNVELFGPIVTPVSTASSPQVNPSASAVNFSLLSDVSASLIGRYGRTSYAANDHLLFADLAVHNAGSYLADAPLLIAITNLSDPSVRVRNADGVTPNGSPYYDFSTLIADGTLSPQDTSGSTTIAFYNPNEKQFTYDIEILGVLNHAPTIVSESDIEALVGMPYTYDVDATDLDGDTVTYSLPSGPPGMSIDSGTGIIIWTPATSDLGSHAVLVEVSDGRGGYAQQRFTLSTIAPPPNRPPLFTSLPIVTAAVNTEYRYQARAVDADGDSLIFSLISGPVGLNVDAASGLVSWTPSGNQTGLQSVSVLVSDGRGGTATQDYSISAGPQPGNTPPVIISQPVRNFDTPESSNSASGNVTPVRIDLDLTAGASSTQTVSITLPAISSGQSFADILFVVDESTSMGGDQDWVEEMIPVLDAALEARGIGPNRYSVVGFGGNTSFRPSREPGHPFNLIETATLTLFGPTASTALGSTTLGPILTPNAFEVTATSTGTQLMLVSDTADRLGGYRFRVLQPSTTTTPLQVGGLTSGSIDVLREEDRYTFTLAQPAQLYFDALTNNDIIWSLSGPAGAAVTNRQFTASDARISHSPALNLVAGDYTLSVTGASNITGSYQFRLSDLASAMPLTPGTPITASLSPANESEIYRFTASAGDRFYFDLIERPTTGDAFLKLLDPYGNQLFRRPLFEGFQLDVADVTLAQSGSYTLLLEGGIADTVAGTYRLNVQPSPITTVPMTLGTQINSAIAVPGEQDRYTFTLPNTELLYFDSLTNASNLLWKLTGPSGTLDARRFAITDGASFLGNPVYRLPSGNYTLNVEGTDETIGAYAFRLNTLAVATGLTPGATITGELNPGNETDFYKFMAAAGDRFSFDLQTRTHGGSSVWRLVDPYGNLIFSKPFADTTLADVATLTLVEPGSYTLLIEGNIADTTSGNYSFVVTPQGNTLPPPPAPSTAMSLGNVVSASIGVVGEQDRYSFTLANESIVYFDSLTNSSNFNWTLTGPAGTAVSARSFSNSDSLAITNPVVKLAAGKYTLVVAATAGITGNYAFRLSDLAAVTSTTPGTVISGDLNPANETDLYKFGAVAGDRFYFDVTARGSAGSSIWRLVDPYGNILSTASFNSVASDFGLLQLTQTGSYTLMLEGAIGDTVPGSYSFNVQPATGSTTPLTLGSAVSSSLASVGDQDRYTFNVASTTQLYFDALTNNADLTWTLTGPAGIAADARSFTNSASLVTVPAGQYTLSIDLPSDKTGNYAFRLIDLASATSLTFGVPVTSSLSPANETDIYRFSALPSDRLYFDVTSRTTGSQARWQLIDPYGNSVFNNFFTETGFSDVEAPNFLQPGVYTLLVEGAITDAGVGNYTFNVQPIPTASTPLAVNLLTNGIISTVGEKDNYSFTLNSASLLNFDSLTNSTRLTWSLRGPTGTIVSNRTFDTSDGFNVANPVVNVPAGDYVLTVDGTGDSVGNYSFRLSDLSASESLTPGTPVSGSLSPANATKLYKFDANGGDSFYFDVQSRSGANSARWRLIDPFGSIRFGTGFATSSDVDTLNLAATGSYTLLIEGALTDTGVGTYTFNVQPVTVSMQVLALGSTVSGSIGVAGEQDRYTFKLNSPSLLYFDSLTNSGSIAWTLSGPSGTVVQSRDFNLNNGEQTQPILNLVGGDYTLTVDGKSDTVAAYEFRLSDLSLATAIVPGTPVTGSLSPGNETDLYSFHASSADHFFFDQQGRTGGAAFWRLVDPLGNIVFLSSFDNSANDVDTLTIAQSGTYTVLVEGAVVATSPATYAFTIQPVNLVTQPLVLGNTIAGAIAVAGEQERYTFTLPGSSLLYFDSLTNNGNINWTLTGPAGTAVLKRSFNFNNGESNQPLLNLVAGDYTLTIDGSGDTTGAYEFRLSDALSATTIAPDQAISGSLDPAKQTDMYRFSALANQRFSFDLQTRGGGLGNARWRLVDPYGTILFNTSFTSTTSSDVATMTLAQSGNYTLLIEGAITDTEIGTYTFAVVSQGTATPPPPSSSTPLVLGTTINDLLSTAGEQDRYSFSLTTASLLYFDALTNNGNLNWSLTGPIGTVINNRNFLSSDSVNVGANPVLNLPNGDYTLTVSASGTVTGAYSFRLSSLSSATAITPGISVSDSLNVANETDLYRFSAVAGDRFYFDTQARTNPGNARQRLIDPFGNILFFAPFTGGDVDVFTVTQTGTFTLLLEGHIGDTGIGSYTFNVQPAGSSTTALTINSPVSGSLATPGDQDHYTFTLSEATLLAFDARTNNSNLLWNLIGPSGAVVSNRSFTNSDAANGNPVLNLTAGDYRLTIDAINDVISTYDFRLNSLASAFPITPGASFSGTLSPSNETDLYRFSASAGDRIFFDTVTQTNGGTARQRLVDPYGNVLFTNVFTGGDVDVVTLPQTGVYTLLLEGGVTDTGIGTYAFNVQPATFATRSLDLSEPVNTLLSVAGDQHNYTFSGSVGQRLFFDRLGLTTNNILPTLFAPSGNQVFTVSSSGSNFGPFFLPETGTYRLSIDGLGDAFGPYGFELHDIATLPRPTTTGDIAGTLEFPLGSDLFQIDAAAGQKLVFMSRDDLYVGTAEQASAAMRAFVANGNFEDGYQAINTGLNLDVYRPGAARNVIFVSDEDRDILDPSLNFVSTFSALDSVGALLNGVHDAQFRDANNRVVLGVDSDGTAYLADGAGGFTTTSGGNFVATVRPLQTTKADYIDLAWALGGAAWDVNLLRGGGPSAASFTKAFVEVKAREIEEQLAIDLVASIADARIQNLTGPVTGIGANETATFNVQLTSDGTPQSFDLLFTRPGSNMILGSIPVTLNTDNYQYPVQAIDADGDVISFSLLTAPTDASIDAISGRITWSPPGVGVYRFVIQADDGRGGHDTQEYEVNVTSGAANSDPTITSTPPSQATTGLPFSYQVHANDLDGDLLNYFLTQAPTGMSIDNVSGIVTWTPTNLQGGPQNVGIRVIDGRGGEATQTFLMNVVADTSNRAPRITSTPLTTVAAGETYRYAASAIDSDNDALSFDLVVAPDGMAVNSSGLIAWPPVAENVGVNSVILRVRDGRGGVHLQSFQVTVTAPGTAPCFSTGAPGMDAIVGRPYQYQFQAQDADGDSVTFRMDSGPLGLTINAITGVLAWTPSADQVGPNSVVISAIDRQGLRTSIVFSLQVRASATTANIAPVINSLPRTSIGLGATYLYQIVALDANSDPLTTILQSAPTGMTLSAEGMLQWQPLSNQHGNSNDIVILVEDGRGGLTRQSFAVEVTSERSNVTPRITSAPLLTAVVGREYHDELQGLDSDNDPTFWSLTTAPRGMSIHPTLGTLCWHPDADQLGPAEVVVQLDDGQGGVSTQEFTINVRAVNLPPTIVSTPLTQGDVINTFAYAVRADDPDGDILSYSLTTRPVGMTIDPRSGLINWAPTSNQIGDNNVVVSVNDGQGGITTQTFGILVSVTPANQPPRFTTIPSLFASAGLEYHYAAAASDIERDALTFASASAPTGMTINATTGLLKWTPTVNQIGNQNVRLTVTDVAGNIANQRFAILVKPANRSPQINSSPVLSATVGQDYNYDISANDPDDDAIAYSLTSAPTGMTIDTFGRIRWATTIADIGLHSIVVQASDTFGASATQSYQLAINADTEAPRVLVEVSESPAALGGEVTLLVSATDNVGVTSLVLTVDGIPVPVDSDGVAVIRANTVGTVAISVKALDASNNVGQDATTLQVIDLSDVNAPTVEITSPADDAVIGNLVDIVGTVTDSNLQFYKLEVASLGFDTFTEIARGTSNVVGGVLGKLDPTMLQNDTYFLRLTAADTAGNIATSEQIIHIAGELKLGNFNLSFVDLTVPVFGVPITVGRTYDTLTASQSGDFGFGWRLEFRDMNLRTSVAASKFKEIGIYNPFKTGSRVYLTLPGGERQGFTFRPTVASGFRGSFLGIFEPRFVPDAGVKSSLTVNAADLRFKTDGTLYDYATGKAYNPADRAFGGSYLLTTKEGVAYSIDGTTGNLTALSDPTNNVLQFTDAGISGTDGKSVAFERDPQGRIVAVVDPAGHRLVYQYDARGDLVAVADRTNNETQFDYLASPSHYLDKVIDPLGRIGVRTEYDAQGRLIKLLDAAGNPVQFNYDPVLQLNTVTDPLGNTTTEFYDDRGNTIRTVDALGGITSSTFDADNNTTSITDPLGRTTTYTYNDRGDAISRTNPLGHTSISTYQAFTYGTTNLAAGRGQAAAPFTRLKTETDALGNTTSFAYVENTGELMSTTDGAGQSVTMEYDRLGRPPSAIKDPNGNVTLFETNSGVLIRQIDALGHATVFTYDANGNQQTSSTTVTDGDGTLRALVTRVEHDAEGRMIAVTDVAGIVTRTEYNAAGFKTATIDGLGRRTEYLYDARNYLIEVVLPDSTPSNALDNPRIKSIHDAVGREMTHIDELGQRTGYVYDALGRRVKTIFPDGTPDNPLDNPVSLRMYDAVGQVVAQIDERGDRTEFEYDSDGHQTISRDALGNITRTFFDAAGRTTAKTDPLFRTTQYSFDAANRLTETTYADGTNIQSKYDAGGRLIATIDQLNQITRYEYDRGDRIITVVDALGHLTTYSYDENGNRVSSTTKQSTADGTLRNLTSRTKYDSLGRVIVTTDSEGGVSRIEYDSVGNMLAKIDPLGRRTEYRYDERDRLIETVHPDDTPVDVTDNLRTKIEYDATGQQIARIDELGRRTQYQYDTLGRRVRSIYPDGASTQTEYDFAGQVSARIDERGNRTEFEYDANGRPTAVHDALGKSQRFAYDAAGQGIAQTDALGHISQFVYDSGGRQIQTDFADGTKVLSSYDARGQLISYTDQLGQTTHYERDALGQVTAEVNALNQRTEYAYDEAGNLVSQMDANGHVMRFEYDGLARRTAMLLPLGQRSETTYDAVSNVIAKTDFNGATIAFAYDPLNRLASKQLPDGLSVSYAYTPTGQTSEVFDSRGATTYSYDSRDRLLMRGDPDGSLASYSYDAHGNRTSLTATVFGASLTTSYTFDTLNRLHSVTDPNSGQTRYSYDNVGNLVLTERANGTSESRDYDELNRLVFVEHRGNSEVISSQRYFLNANGQRATVLEHDGRRVEYSYDPIDRLTRESIIDAFFGDRSFEYSYDHVGNRLTRNDSVAGMTLYSYDSNDRLLTETLNGTLTQYTYDDNGNTLSHVKASDTVFNTWDFENRLTAVDTDGDGTIDVQNRYDDFSNRVSQTVDGQETRFLLDTAQTLARVLLEYRSSGLIEAFYIPGISQTRSGATTYYHADGLGSTRAITDDTGEVRNRYRYDAFGRVIQQSGNTVNTYQFAGQQRDSSLGLDYLRARYYDPSLGRFISPDPLRGSIAEPIYAYAANDPVNRTDPSGLSTLSELGAALRIVGDWAIKGAIIGAAQGAIDGAIRGGLDGALAGAWRGLKTGAVFGAFLGVTKVTYGLGAVWGIGSTYTVVATAASVRELITTDSNRDRAAAIFNLLFLGTTYTFGTRQYLRSKQFKGESDGALLQSEIIQYQAELQHVNTRASGPLIEVSGVANNGHPRSMTLVDTTGMSKYEAFNAAQRAQGDYVNVILEPKLGQFNDAVTSAWLLDFFMYDIVNYGNNHLKTFVVYVPEGNMFIPVRSYAPGQAIPQPPSITDTFPTQGPIGSGDPFAATGQPGVGVTGQAPPGHGADPYAPTSNNNLPGTNPGD